jgi:transcriptional regulator with XRE-family HTH domain
MSQDIGGNFGKWLRAARRKKGWSGELLAVEIGTSQGNISLYERGLRHPHRERAVELATALGADPREALQALMKDTPGMDDQSIRERHGEVSEYTTEILQLLALFPAEERLVIVENLKRTAQVRGLGTGKEGELVD